MSDDDVPQRKKGGPAAWAGSAKPAHKAAKVPKKSRYVSDAAIESDDDGGMVEDEDDEDERQPGDSDEENASDMNADGDSEEEDAEALAEYKAREREREAKREADHAKRSAAALKAAETRKRNAELGIEPAAKKTAKEDKPLKTKDAPKPRTPAVSAKEAFEKQKEAEAERERKINDVLFAASAPPRAAAPSAYPTGGFGAAPPGVDPAAYWAQQGASYVSGANPIPQTTPAAAVTNYGAPSWLSALPTNAPGGGAGGYAANSKAELDEITKKLGADCPWEWDPLTNMHRHKSVYCNHAATFGENRRAKVYKMGPDPPNDKAHANMVMVSCAIAGNGVKSCGLYNTEKKAREIVGQMPSVAEACRIAAGIIDSARPPNGFEMQQHGAAYGQVAQARILLFTAAKAIDPRK